MNILTKKAITPRNFSFSAFGPLAAHAQELFVMSSLPRERSEVCYCPRAATQGAGHQHIVPHIIDEIPYRHVGQTGSQLVPTREAAGTERYKNSRIRADQERFSGAADERVRVEVSDPEFPQVAGNVSPSGAGVGRAEHLVTVDGICAPPVVRVEHNIADSTGAGRERRRLRQSSASCGSQKHRGTGADIKDILIVCPA